ncbi:MAG: thioredoxin family protein [Deltaproteobacteria bacterium]|nr:thioredoxin family protein [Deltaproteobacteria bacterium]
MPTVKQLAAAVLVVGVIGVPLWLKRTEPVTADRASTTQAASAKTTKAPLPKLVDLGTRTCVPCKAMLVVLDELDRTYAGQLAIEFINVQEQPRLAEEWGVEIIPTQVFVGSDGRELYRHTGYLSTKDIVERWRALGYPLQPPNR